MWIELDGEGVVYDLEGEKLHVLNPSALSIWQRCDGTTTLARIVEELTNVFDAERVRIEQDVLALVKQLSYERLVETTRP